MQKLNIVGNTYKANAGYSFTVVSYLGNKQYLIKFLNTGHIRKANRDNFTNGKVRDPYERTCYGEGYLGSAPRPSYYKQANQLWRNMLKRCYSDKDPRGYKWKGTTVDERWKCLSNFVADLPDLEGFDSWLEGGMNLDKDFKIPNNNVYSKEACSFIPEGENKAAGARTTVAGYQRTLLKDKRS